MSASEDARILLTVTILLPWGQEVVSPHDLTGMVAKKTLLITLVKTVIETYEELMLFQNDVYLIPDQCCRSQSQTNRSLNATTVKY